MTRNVKKYCVWIILFILSSCALMFIVYEYNANYEVLIKNLIFELREEGQIQERGILLQISLNHTFDEGYTDITNPEFLNYLRKHWILPPPNLPQKLPTKKHPKNSYDYSQLGQCKLVDELLSKKQNGFFIESGAADGIEISNTIFFEMERNWSGILIEPNPLFFKKMEKVHRRAYLLNSCINTANVTRRLEFITNSFLGGIKGQSHSNQLLSSRTIQCFPLWSIISALNNPKIDYLSLDVEGPELDILKTIPFTKVFIDVISVEYRVIGVTGDILFTNTTDKLTELREFFNCTRLYKEIAILPVGYTEESGVDVVFKRINS